MIRPLTVLLLLLSPGAAQAGQAFRPDAFGRWSVPVSVGGRCAPFLLDTGSPRSVVTDALVRDAGLAPEPGPKARVMTPQGPVSRDLYRVAGVRFDGADLPEVAGPALPARDDLAPGTAGLLGLDALALRPVLADFAHGRAGFVPDAEMKAAQARGVDAWSFTRGPRGHLLFEAWVDGVPVTAVLNTAAPDTVLNRKAAEALGRAQGPERRVATVAGFSTARDVGASTIRIGRTDLKAARTAAGDVADFGFYGVADRPAVVLGADVLAGSTLWLDLKGGRVLARTAAPGRASTPAAVCS